MGVRRCKKSLNLHKFTVLIGPNNAGKTSLLLALFLAPYPWTAYFLPIIERRKVEFLVDFLHRDLRSLIYRYSGKLRIKYQLEDKEMILELQANKTPAIYQSDGSRIEGHDKLLDYLRLEGVYRENPARYSLLIPDSDSFLDKLDEGLVFKWEDVEKSGAHYKLVKDYVNKAIQDKSTEVGIRPNELAIRKELPDGEPYWINLGHVGSGVRRFLTSALWLEAVKPKVVLWDDFEASAHPALVKASLEWLANHEWQVVLSTHSIDVLREVAFLDVEDAAVLSLRRYEDDTLTYTQYSLDELVDMFEKGQDVRKLLAL